MGLDEFVETPAILRQRPGGDKSAHGGMAKLSSRGGVLLSESLDFVPPWVDRAWPRGAAEMVWRGWPVGTVLLPPCAFRDLRRTRAPCRGSPGGQTALDRQTEVCIPAQCRFLRKAP